MPEAPFTPRVRVALSIDGDDPGATKPLLVRGVGPALGLLGVPGVLADPKLTLYSGDAAIATNDNWNGEPTIAALSSQVGAFPFASPTSRDAVLLVTLAPGSYTVHASGVDSTSGVALFELYDLP